MRVSLITPCFNARAHIATALDSVAAQTGGDVEVEHIVVDGGSTDGTGAEVQARPGVTFVNGPDRGIYDALDKGIARASGDYVGFVNADDMLLPGAVTAWVAAAVAAGLPEVVTADAVGCDAELARSLLHYDASRLGLDLEAILLGVPVFNARLYRRDVLRRFGPLHSELALAADRLFLARLALAGISQTAAARPVYAYRLHDGSRTLSGNAASRRTIHREHLVLARMLLGDPLCAAAADIAAIRRFRALETVRLCRVLPGLMDRLAVLRQAFAEDIGWVGVAARGYGAVGRYRPYSADGTLMG